MNGLDPHRNGLDEYRERLDGLDDGIARLLGERFEVCREIALYKRAHEIPMMQPERVAQVRARYLERGREAGLPSGFTEALFELLIGATCRMEDELIAAPSVAAEGDGAPLGDAAAAGDAAPLGDAAPVGDPGAWGDAA